MAQAARLNLRMQKELKLLLTDPPPSASFPSLSSQHQSSLTSIDADFQGPDETVYANGVFKIKIQIPERYPFQPPIVTFATPIYHPNIDNGGRICLDILNLPPKGTWQPSLNISTVLTSIGLLLSEPNPDDGLMHEASREYKYNRQAFDQKARSMTEKYARIGNSEGSSSAQTENKGPDETICTNGHTETGEFRETKDVATGYSMNPDIRKTTGNKLSLKFPVVSHSTNGETTNMNMTNQCSSLLEANQVVENHKLESHSDENFRKPRHSPSVNQEQPSAKCVKTSPSKDSSEKRHSFPEHDFSQLDSSRNEKTNPRKDATPRDSRGSASFKLKKVSLQNEKENLVPKPFSSESGLYYNEIKGKQAVKMATKLPFKPLKQIVGNNGNIIMHSEDPSGIISHNKQKINEDESVVVLDSEDSEDENVTVRSKLSLARRCLSRKRKSAIS